MSESKDLTDATLSVTENIVSILQKAASAKDAADPRLFFPNGIELIDIVVKLTPPDVEVKIAGEKGIKCDASLLRKLEEEQEDVGKRNLAPPKDVNDTNHDLPVTRGDTIPWFNNTARDSVVQFTHGNPLDHTNNPFTVKANSDPAHPGASTHVQSDLPVGTWFPYTVTVGGVQSPGMPKICIIQ